MCVCGGNVDMQCDWSPLVEPASAAVNAVE